MYRDWERAREVEQRKSFGDLEHALVLHGQRFYCCSAGGPSGLEEVREVCGHRVVPRILVDCEESGLERDDLGLQLVPCYEVSLRKFLSEVVVPASVFGENEF